MKCTLYTQKKQATLVISKLILFYQCKIICAKGNTGAQYYLIFHRDRYINAIKTDHLKPESFLFRAIEQGMTIHRAHPIVYDLLKQSPFAWTSARQVKKKTHRLQPDMEQVTILSYFDQYIAPKTIIELYQNCFRSFKREGQLQKAYQSLVHLNRYQPNLTFYQDMIAAVEFQNYHTEQSTDSVTDPIVFALTMKENDSARLTSQLSSSWNTDEWHQLWLLLQNYPSRVIFTTLEHMLRQNESLIQEPPFTEVLLSQATAKQFFNTLKKQSPFSHLINFDLFKQQLDALTVQRKISLLKNKPNYFINLIQNFSMHEKEQLIKPIVNVALQTESIPLVKQWLQDLPFNISLKEQLATMERFEQDELHQKELANLYIEFNNPLHAIECLKWSLAIDTDDLSCYKQLIELLRSTNQEQEADVYQNQLIHLARFRSLFR
ncbi:hypothetical protein SAMN04488134_11081 [Amphibacillus marinus]|uniref:Uncharacterized protein n=1 Tax=Amphibacillus marinus TaxID=872970 RepID=A0A1H8RGK4_9BACI|nr:hypothetical protein [Amphibacillus marinus]SEO65496.1 hypothetical protein SAMN04488134_11081 [Amphibacillus marinus]